MADFDIAIPAEHEAAPAARQGARAASLPASRAKGGGLSFERFLVFTVLAVGSIGAYESVTESLYPSYSLLWLAHAYGYLKDYAIVYEPSKGIWHPVGWAGSAMMVVMMLYTVRKRLAFLGFLGSMRRWLSVHMFFGIMGPLLVTLHTTFKFHGLIATSFWCMIVTMVFGILGRYIYVQIPRSITGAELGVKEIEGLVAGIEARLSGYGKDANLSRFLAAIDDRSAGRTVEMSLPAALAHMVWTDLRNRARVWRASGELKARFNLGREARRDISALLGRKAALVRKKNLLATSHRMLHYWHVFHIPLAIVMFLIMFLHIAVYYIFRPIS